MRFRDEGEAITYIFRSMHKLPHIGRGLDEHTRDINPTRRLLAAHNLLATPREYTVVTGSKGKGSTVAITAKLLQHLGHTVGMMTSPHMVDWRERIRVNGRAIPMDDLLRILSDLAPEIDAIEATFTGSQYFSPQGIFLAVALKWFDEQGVNAAVLEVGRGGRFDDVSVVPNSLSLFTPILIEHPDYLGRTLDRIAWHKAGIIKPYSYVYSIPQSPEVMQVLQAEAESLSAEFNWIAPKDLGEYLEPAQNGQRFMLGRYGEVTLSLLGRHQIDNASLAVIAAGNIHARLGGIPHASPEYVERIRAGLADVIWPGRCQKLQDNPPIYVDGAITVPSAQSLVKSLDGYLRQPIITICAVPVDRDYEGVYAVLGPASSAMILTETDINPKIRFPAPDVALEAAHKHNSDVSFAPNLSAAVESARVRAVQEGSILLSVAQPLVGEALLLWNLRYEVI